MLHSQPQRSSSERNADLCKALMSVILVVHTCIKEITAFCLWHQYYFSYVFSEKFRTEIKVSEKNSWRGTINENAKVLIISQS